MFFCFFSFICSLSKGIELFKKNIDTSQKSIRRADVIVVIFLFLLFFICQSICPNRIALQHLENHLVLSYHHFGYLWTSCYVNSYMPSDKQCKITVLCQNLWPHFVVTWKYLRPNGKIFNKTKIFVGSNLSILYLQKWFNTQLRWNKLSAWQCC